ncbi:MAG: hypothetical protein KAG97_05035 [Victivallales bacterium]|nr:hypothetical protein [Victivallales bacterium]
MGKLSERFETARNTIKAAGTPSGFLPECSYTSAKDNFPEVTIAPLEQKNIIFLRAAHMGITVDPAFKDNVLFLLSNRPC